MNRRGFLAALFAAPVARKLPALEEDLPLSIVGFINYDYDPNWKPDTSVAKADVGKYQVTFKAFRPDRMIVPVDNLSGLGMTEDEIFEIIRHPH